MVLKVYGRKRETHTKDSCAAREKWLGLRRMLKAEVTCLNGRDTVEGQKGKLKGYWFLPK